MRQETIVNNIYAFEELSDAAKEKALQDYCTSGMDYEWWDYIYEDAAAIAELFGFDIRQRRVDTTDGGHRYEPSIYFSGFYSQGDGACCEGDYRYMKGALRQVKEYAPQDKELHEIVAGLQAFQRRYFYGIRATVKHSGHYYHSGCTSIDVTWTMPSGYEEYPDLDTQEDVAQLLREFMDWIYSQLEKEWDYQTSEEAFIETCEANGYEFTADGSLY